mgnify:FL=1
MKNFYVFRYRFSSCVTVSRNYYGSWVGSSIFPEALHLNTIAIVSFQTLRKMKSSGYNPSQFSSDPFYLVNLGTHPVIPNIQPEKIIAEGFALSIMSETYFKIPPGLPNGLAFLAASSQSPKPCQVRLLGAGMKMDLSSPPYHRLRGKIRCRWF